MRTLLSWVFVFALTMGYQAMGEKEPRTAEAAENAKIQGSFQTVDPTQTYRLYDGITAYINNPEGESFNITLDVRDINVFAGGPRELLLKVYDPDGVPILRRIIPDDGVESKGYLPRLGGWDHELEYYAACYGSGTQPMIRWSMYSDPKRLATVAKRTFALPVEGGKNGIYRILIVGDRDHCVSLRLDPALSYAVCGHTTWLHGHGSHWRRSYIYVPKGTVGLHLGFAEPDLPRTRRFTLTDPDGKKLFDGLAAGILAASSIKFEKPAQYDDKVLTLDVSEGPNDFLVHVILQRSDSVYAGMGSLAVFAPDRETAEAVKGGAIYRDGETFWHMFQVRLNQWIRQRSEDVDTSLADDVRALAAQLRLIGPGDARGTAEWTNLAYSFGYYGTQIWRRSWMLMRRDDVPQQVKDTIREALFLGGDRLSFAVGIERVNGNAFAQIPVALWYCSQASGDELQKERFEVFFQRFLTQGWGEGAGISRSGDCQEHFAHDNHYGRYILENWAGPLRDITDPRFKAAYDRICALYDYIWCPGVAACPWSSRTHLAVDRGPAPDWKGKPGPDLTADVNGGSEWFAARRKNYYIVTFHGRLAPEWLCNTFYGQIGFGGGIICHLSVPGKGTVLASTLAESYGKGMDLPNWRNFHIHSIVGQMADGRPLSAGASEHMDARLQGNVVTSSGEVRGLPVKSTRSYTFGPDDITCAVQLAATDYQQILTLWSQGRRLSDIQEAYEMIPFLPGDTGKPTKVILLDAGGRQTGELSETPADAKTVVIDRGGYGARIELEKPMKVLRGAKDTVLIKLTEKTVSADEIAVKYRIVPFLGQQ